MLIALLDDFGAALLDDDGAVLVMDGGDLPDPTEGAIDYFLSFESEAEGRADPVIASYLSGSAYRLPIWAYNAVTGFVIPGWWIQITADVPFVSDLIGHPNLKLAVNTAPDHYPVVVRNNMRLGVGSFWFENSGMAFHFSAYGLTASSVQNGFPTIRQPADFRKRMPIRALPGWVGRRP